jgi:FlaG/FlaF family flagellin (archaellin)
MKAISPAVGTILIVIITVGIVAFSYSWFISTGETGKKTTSTVISNMEKVQ